MENFKKFTLMDENTTVITSTNTNTNYVEIPFPLKRSCYYKEGILTITVDFGKIFKQMQFWNSNQERGV
jgi:hypothetical protein